MKGVLMTHRTVVKVALATLICGAGVTTLVFYCFAVTSILILLLVIVFVLVSTSPEFKQAQSLARAPSCSEMNQETRSVLLL